MKKNVTILIGLVVVIAVLFAGNSFMKKSGKEKVSNKDTATSVAMKSFESKVLRGNAGENVLDYTVSIPETATTSLSMDGALLKVTDADNSLVYVYMSYEGARGYSALDYINNRIVPNVAVLEITSTSTIGGYEWQAAESEGSEWHVASVAGGKWLVVVENKKAVHDTANKVLESIVAK